jgi:TctA family transporter
VVTVIDGYQMARKGRAGPALAAAGLGSFFAGCVGTLILAAFAAPLTEVAFKFGPEDFNPVEVVVDGILLIATVGNGGGGHSHAFTIPASLSKNKGENRRLPGG